jgi:hypothetical protein
MNSQEKSIKRIRILPFLPIILLPVILLFQFLFGGRVFYWGISSLQFIPWRAYAFTWLQQGVFPFWNGLNGMGAPLAANYQLAIFYPPTWGLYLTYLLGGIESMAIGHQWLIAIHLIWAGIGMAVLLRSLGGSRLAQTITGICFGMGGYLSGRLGFYSMIWVAAWFPWLVFFANCIGSPVKKKLDIRCTKSFFFLAICTAMMLLAGHAQLSWYILIFVYAWVICGAWIQDGFRGAIRAGIVLTGAVLLGVLLSAVQLIPTGEYLLQSQRSGAVDYETMMSYSYWPWRLITLFAPNFFGNPGTGNYWGYGNFWEDDLYFGVLPLFLSLSTLRVIFSKGDQSSRSASNQRGLVIFLWVFIFISFILGMGRNTILFPLLARYVPTFDMFNAPARFLVWAAFSLSLLVGIGCDRWARPQGRALYWMRLGTAAGFAITLGALLTWYFLRDVNSTFIQATVIAGVWSVGAGLLTLFMPDISRERQHRIWISLVVVWVSIDVLSASWQLNPAAPADFYTGKNNKFIQALDGHRFYLSPKADYRLKYDRFIRFEDFRPLEDIRNERKIELPNMNLLDGVASINNFDPLIPGSYATWLDLLENASESQRIRLLKLNDGGILDELDPNDSLGVHWKKIDGASHVNWFNCAISSSSEEDALEKVGVFSQQIDFPSQNTPLVIEGNPGKQTNDCAQTRRPEIEMQSNRPDQITSTVKSETAGWLFLADTWYPGWDVKVDGRPVTVYRAFVNFMAVQIPSGNHVVEFIYHPRIFWLGLIASAAGWIIMFTSIIILKKRGDESGLPHR